MEQKEDNEHAEEGSKIYKVPYGSVREAVFRIDVEKLKDAEHSARLQYRLLLNDAILSSDAEFSKQKLTIVYNPKGTSAGREGTDLDSIISMLEAVGIHVDRGEVTEREVDYYKDVYSYQFNPQSIREHAPYGYTLEEWQKMKPKYEEKIAKEERKRKEKSEKK